jgi:hypothetical protein
MHETKAGAGNSFLFLIVGHGDGCEKSDRLLYRFFEQRANSAYATEWILEWGEML